MKIFLTGASGFVGNAVATKLSSQHQIVALSRSEASDKKISATGATPSRGELGKITTEQLKAVDVIIHAAAKVEQFGVMDDFWKINVEGTQQLLDAAQQAGVSRFVHIGTEASVFYGQDMTDIDETIPLAFDSPYPYSRTKAHAEERVMKANNPDKGFTTISIRPRLVWGPGDKTVLPVVIEMIKQNKFMWLDGGGAKTVTTHIDNLVAGIELALTKGVGANAYYVTDDEVVTIREFLTQLIATRNVEVSEKSAPGWLISILAKITEFFWKVLRLKSEPPLSVFAIDIMKANCTINITKSRKELGYAPVISVQQGLEELK